MPYMDPLGNNIDHHCRRSIMGLIIRLYRLPSLEYANPNNALGGARNITIHRVLVQTLSNNPMPSIPVKYQCCNSNVAESAGSASIQPNPTNQQSNRTQLNQSNLT